MCCWTADTIGLDSPRPPSLVGRANSSRSISEQSLRPVSDGMNFRAIVFSSG